jgi:hypothetical protein
MVNPIDQELKVLLSLLDQMEVRQRGERIGSLHSGSIALASMLRDCIKCKMKSWRFPESLLCHVSILGHLTNSKVKRT